MAKTYLSHAKYVIHQKFEIKGVVDKHDIIGAIFGQSEGIIGEGLDLRELQGSGKIGRIELDLEAKNGITNGALNIPSGSDMVETSILAATIEVVDKVGPCDAKFATVRIEDTRITKRKVIVANAKRLLSKLIAEEIPDSQEIANEVRSEVRTAGISDYGRDKLPAGPHLLDCEEIIVVEGRADVINLLKYNIKNVVAMGGSRIPHSIVELSKRKEITAFVDGDRGGELDLKRLLQIAEIDYVARAPTGKEVEELTKKEILAALNKKISTVQTKAGTAVPVDDIDIGNDKYWSNHNADPIESTNEGDFVEKSLFKPREKPTYGRNAPRKDYNGSKPPFNKTRSLAPKRPYKKAEPIVSRPVEKVVESTTQPKDLKVNFVKEMTSLKNSSKAKLFEKSGKEIILVPVKDLLKTLKDKSKNLDSVVFDGNITKRVAELAKSKGARYLIGAKKGKMSKIKGLEIIEYSS